jgi:Tfp pilus assembly protein PilO
VKRNHLLIAGAAVVAVALLWYFLLYAPLGDDLSSAQSQRSTEEKKTSDLQATLTRLQGQAKNATQQQALLRKLDAAVPEQPDLAEFIIQANEIADQSGIQFLSISPTPPAAGNGASVISLTVSIKGSFFQLEDYLRLLEKLERLVVVDGVTVSASSGGSGSSSSDTGGGSGSSGDVSLSVTLNARMFTRAAPTSSPGGSNGTGGTSSGGTTPTTTAGSATTPTTTAGGATTTPTTAPASGSGSTTGGT